MKGVKWVKLSFPIMLHLFRFVIIVTTHPPPIESSVLSKEIIDDGVWHQRSPCVWGEKRDKRPSLVLIHHFIFI